MSTIFRIGLSRLSNNFSSLLCKPVQTNLVQVCTIKRKVFLQKDIENEDRQYPSPFPIWERYPTTANLFNDPIYYKATENSKLIVVDGPIAVGKSRVAEKLADEFGMLYMPPPTFDDLYIDEYGFDKRSLDHLLPVKAKYEDLKKFLLDPWDFCVPSMQIAFLLMRLEQHFNAVSYVLSTGQGVVLNRCAHSDEVFAKAMREVGYLTHPEYSIYDEQIFKFMDKILRPHLVVYLDCSIDTVKKNIKKRNNPLEVQSEAFTDHYLEAIEHYYKDHYLRKIEDHAVVLAYDWNEQVDIDFMVHDIEETNFDLFRLNYDKMADWTVTSKEMLHDLRLDHCHFEKRMMEDLGATRYTVLDLPERMKVSDDDVEKRYQIEEAHIPRRYRKGYENLSFWEGMFKGLPDPFERQPEFRLSPKDFINVEKSLGAYRQMIKA